MQEELVVGLPKFIAYTKEHGAETLIQKLMGNYSELEPYVNTEQLWEEDPSSQLEETLTRFIKITQLNF